MEETVLEDSEDVFDETFHPRKKHTWKRPKFTVFSEKVKRKISSSQALFYAKRMGFRVEAKLDEVESKIDEEENELEINSKTNNEPNHNFFTRSALKKEIKKDFSKDKRNINWSDGLPYEILLKIFVHFMQQANGDLTELRKVRYVCKYWSAVSNDSQLWQTLALDKILPKHTEKNHPKQNETKFIKKFDKFLSCALEQNKFQFLVKLVVFDLQFLTCDHVHLILSNCNQKYFSELTLASCKKVNTSEKGLQIEKVVADFCPNLRLLDLSSNEVSIVYLLNINIKKK